METHEVNKLEKLASIKYQSKKLEEKYWELHTLLGLRGFNHVDWIRSGSDIDTQIENAKAERDAWENRLNKLKKIRKPLHDNDLSTS